MEQANRIRTGLVALISVLAAPALAVPVEPVVGEAVHEMAIVLPMSPVLTPTFCASGAGPADLEPAIELRGSSMTPALCDVGVTAGQTPVLSPGRG